MWDVLDLGWVWRSAASVIRVDAKTCSGYVLNLAECCRRAASTELDDGTGKGGVSDCLQFFAVRGCVDAGVQKVYPWGFKAPAQGVRKPSQ